MGLNNGYCYLLCNLPLIRLNARLHTRIRTTVRAYGQSLSVWLLARRIALIGPSSPVGWRCSWLSARRARVGSLSRTRTAHRTGWCATLSRDSAAPLCACAHTSACHARSTTLHVSERCASDALTDTKRESESIGDISNRRDHQVSRLENCREIRTEYWDHCRRVAQL